MEELNKTQLILLALLVSFVTSIATGIVTVALMDQAPPAITQTINRVIKETERIIVPEKQQATVETVVVKEEDYIVKAVDMNTANVVTINALEKRKSRLGFTNAADTKRNISALGMGVALSKDGVVAFPSAFLLKGEEFVYGTRGGRYFLITVIKQDESTGLALARAGKEFVLLDEETEGTIEKVIDLAKEVETPSAFAFAEVTFASGKDVKLGETAVAIGLFGADPRILLGTVSGIGVSKEGETVALYTTISGGVPWNGSPLFDSVGRLTGITLLGTDGTHSAVFGQVAKTLLDAVIAGEEVEKEL